MLDNYVAIRDAIQQRSRVLARQRSTWLTLCPHVLGWRKDDAYLVAFAVSGMRKWLCLPVAEINYVRPTDGAWLPRTGSPPPPAEMELDFVVAAATDAEAVR